MVSGPAELCLTTRRRRPAPPDPEPEPEPLPESVPRGREAGAEVATGEAAVSPTTIFPAGISLASEGRLAGVAAEVVVSAAAVPS